MNRIVIVSGACGVGKSEVLRSMRRELGDRVADVAVLETDHFYMIIDPHWDIPYDEGKRYHDLSGFLLQQAARHLARKGFDWVAIGSNGLNEESHVREFAEPFSRDGCVVHHVTLDPGPETLVKRMAHRIQRHDYTVDAIKTPEWLTSQLEWFRDRYGPWTFVIDNSSLTPSETVLAIYDAVENGKGRLE
jgi:hypothetical protein